LKNAFRISLLCWAVVFSATVAAQARPASAPGSGAELEKVLDRMDQEAAGFQSAEADFVWDQYQRVINDVDTQKGVVYYRRHSGETQMAADITVPDQKYVLFSEGKVRLYQPKIEQVTEYNAGKNKAEFESFLVLGFGGGGHDLLKSFDVQYLGSESVGGMSTAKLELVPKTQKMRNMFEKIYLWIEPEHGISVQQQFLEPSGDYRLAHYSNIKLNQKIPDSAFKLKTTSKTRWVRP
jgi:outer membrane lipoprotein-sorting protein